MEKKKYVICKQWVGQSYIPGKVYEMINNKIKDRLGGEVNPGIYGSSFTPFEYLKCIEDRIGQFTKGKVYELLKVLKVYEDETYQMMDDNGTYNGWHEKFFKISSKEEYDTQQNPLHKNWYVVITEENKDTMTEWRGCSPGTLIVGKITGLFGENLSKEHNPICNIGGFGSEITFEQFKQHVLKETNMKQTFNITRAQFQEIHGIACNDWKRKIETMVQNKLGSFQNDTFLSFEDVDKMFKASNDTQKETLKNIFPTYQTDKSIDLSKLSDKQMFGDSGMIGRRNFDESQDKAFYLSGNYKWELIVDDSGINCLVPTRK